jgi:hypothetical protein
MPTLYQHNADVNTLQTICCKMFAVWYNDAIAKEAMHMAKQDMIQIGFRCTEEVADALKVLADREQRSVNGQLTMIVLAALDQAGIKPKKGGRP